MKGLGLEDKISVGVHIRRLGNWCEVRFNRGNTLHCGNKKPEEELLKAWGHACNYTYPFVEDIIHNDFGLKKGSYVIFMVSQFFLKHSK